MPTPSTLAMDDDQKSVDDSIPPPIPPPSMPEVLGDLKASETMLRRVMIQLEESNQSRDRALVANNEYLEQTRFMKKVLSVGHEFMEYHRRFEDKFIHGLAPTDLDTEILAKAECEFQALLIEADKKGFILPIAKR